MLVDFGKANPLEKARQQPDKVKQVLEKVKTDGLMPTVEAVRSKLEQPLALGYCNVGVVEEVGQEAGIQARDRQPRQQPASRASFSPGDRVVSNGKHAEMVSVPVNLCARIPETVSDEAAAFTVIGAIALQGIRLVAPTLGEAVVVTGLGLIGLMTVQLLRAHGCRVLGIDMDPAKLALARQFGAETVDLSAGRVEIRRGCWGGRCSLIKIFVIPAGKPESRPEMVASRPGKVASKPGAATPKRHPEPPARLRRRLHRHGALLR
ncbi:zinc-binding alcohol dehydrogenase [Lamprobacter modestohalophilus]|uniref:zinc-dependent alcohol dehydrogenase n=1 Tax=Lamprobacter modestohalophilus TaxID=1064514 RepID=UPI002ADEEB09|nr:zinc-binding alcohol dehydrogenase [Lamprobacter modestohalophilus]MEA1049041.1 zinc-binding alcohol dehydrogenase [Lamprobacter modestohalophilus]